jgi:multiple sugar transport system substrate-binding protein
MGSYRFVLLSTALGMSAFLLFGCSQREQAAPAAETAKQEPVEVTIYSHKLKMTDEYFQRLVTDPMKKKYPYITIKWLFYDGSSKTQDLEKLWSQGIKPDILYASQYYAIEFDTKLKAIADQRDWIKKFNVDLGKFETATMDAIKSYGNKGEIFALPYSSNFSALWYNKDVFDKFGVPYPKDEMKWDDVIALARTMTRVDGGVQYRGIGSNGGDKMLSQLSLPYIDPKTNKAMLDAPGWTEGLNMFKKIFDITGNFAPEHHKSYSDSVEFFRKDKNMAMLPYHNLIERLVESEKQHGLNWDVVTYPDFPGHPHRFGEVQADAFMIAANTPHQEDAFKVVSYLLSDEMQSMLSKSGKVSILKDDKFKKEYGADIPELKTKNIQGIFKSGPAPLHVTSLYEEEGNTTARNVYKAVMSGERDINTALREGKEQLEKKIQSLQGK